MNTSELARFSEVVGLIYEGATDPSLWTKEILPLVGDYLQAPISVMFNPLKIFGACTSHHARHFVSF